jgi:hypothetical protein
MPTTQKICQKQKWMKQGEQRSAAISNSRSKTKQQLLLMQQPTCLRSVNLTINKQQQ